MKSSLKMFMLCAIILATVTSCKTKQKTVSISGSDVKATETKTQPKQVVDDEDDATTATGTEKTRSEKFNLATGETNSAAFNRKYHVVVGSFANQSNAQNLQKTLKGEGNDALVVVNENKMFRVIVASFDDYNQAHQRIDEIRTRFPDAWVLCQK